ncbi:MAG: T9SS type A sorting domain-containing protein [Chitinophagales bacterium]
MRLFFSVFLATAMLTCGLFALQNRLRSNAECSFEQYGEDESAEIMGAMEFDWQRQHDPATGLIPSGKLMQAYNILKARGYYTATHNSDKTEELTGWWQVNDFFPTLAVTKIVYDPTNTDIFYFCTGEGWFNADAVKGAGVFKSVDAGESWVQLPATAISDFDYCQDMVVDPVNGDVYVGTRSAGLQRSTDGGATWEKVLGSGTGMGNNSICDIEYLEGGGFMASIGIFETDGIYYSPTGDAGSWVKQTSGLPTAGYFRIKLATAPSDGDVAYSIYCNSSDYKVKGIYKTTDRGVNWTEISRPENNYEFAARQAWYDLSLAVDPNDPNVVAMGGLNLWRSLDGGDSWQQLSSGGLDSNLIRYVHVDQHEIVFQNSDKVYFTNDGGIWTCDNFQDAQPFIYNLNYGYNVTQFYSVAAHPDYGNAQLMGGTQDNGTPYTYANGIADYTFVSGADGAYTAFNYENGDVFFTATQERRMFRFDNGGYEMPDTITNPHINDGNVLFINPFEIDASNPEVLWQCTNIGIYRFDNASTSDTSGWVDAGNINGVLSAIGTSPAAPGVVFMGRNSSGGNIFRMEGGYTSTFDTPVFDADPNDQLPDAAFLSTLFCSSIYVDTHDANHVLVTYANYGINNIWESNNALSDEPEWHSIEGDLPDIPVYSIVLRPENSEVAYIATELGVFLTDTINGSETNWHPCSNFPIVRTDMLRLRVSDEMIFAGTHGRGLWSAWMGNAGLGNELYWTERGPNNVGGRTRTVMIDPNDPSGKKVWVGSVGGGLWKTADVTTVPTEDIPLSAQADLFKVYPNPVTGDQLQMQWYANNSGTVRFRLYDIRGTAVAEKAITCTQGEQNISWNIPAHITAGNYFVSMQGDGKHFTCKIVILNR